MENRKTALLFGASDGIGFAAARRLARDGIRVAIAARQGERLQSALSQLREIQPDAEAIPVDAKDPESRRRMFERADELFGRLDILVNSVPGAAPVSFVKHRLENIEEGITNKLIPYIDCMKMAFERMKERRWGRIINVVGNMWKEPERGGFSLGIVNAALANAAKSASVELAPYGITVNNLHPGFILTQRLRAVWNRTAELQGTSYEEVEKAKTASVPAGRAGTPEEAAALIAFLVSEDAGYITGQQISVDGGHMRSM
jgi:bacilysin biosynthesis oxidoreductase BacG